MCEGQGIMQKYAPPGLIHYIRELATIWRTEPRSDAELLAAFVELQEETAFTALVVRHGRVVWTTCRRVLTDDADAEDAFQATFIALARQARKLRREPLEGWLRLAAHRAALQATRGARRRSRAQRELYRRADPYQPSIAPPDDELQAAVREELARLPEKLRLTISLYYLDGKTQAEVGKLVGISDRAVAGRLVSALNTMRRRLERRGLVVATAALVALISDLRVAAALSPGLMAAAATTAIHALHGGAVAGPAATIAAGLTAPRVPLTAVVTAIALLGVGGAITVAAVRKSEMPLAEPPSAPPALAAAELKKPDLVRKQGPVVTFAGQVLDVAGKPIPHAEVTAVARRPFRAGDFGLRENTLRAGRADADGRFRLTVPADFPTWYPDRKVVLVASAPGQPPTTLPISASGSQDSIELRLGGAEPLRGKVFDPDGKPAIGVQVSVVRLGDTAWEPIQGAEEGPPPFWPKSAYSDERGEFVLPGLGSTRNVWLQFHDDRFALSTEPVQETMGKGTGRAGEDLEDPGVRPVSIPILSDLPHFRLAPPRLLSGRVLAGDTGLPISHARLAIYAGNWAKTHSVRHTALTSSLEASRAVRADALDSRADIDGRFKVHLPSANQYRLDVFPPAGRGCLALTRQIRWDHGTTGRQEEFRLPRGIELRGRVIEAEGGKPVAGAYAYFLPHSRDNPHFCRDVLCDRHTFANTAPDGTFRLTVPAGPGELQVYGPDWQYIPQLLIPQSGVPGPNRRLRYYVSALKMMDVPTASEHIDVEVALRRGMSVSGSVTGPDGVSASECVLVCCGKITPLRNRVVVPLPVRDGNFTLPGCEPGHTYPVLFLDARHMCGALVDVIAYLQKATAPPIRLEPCGTAKLRVIDPDGRPAACCQLEVSVLLEPDCATGDAAALAARPDLADPYAISWIDSINYGQDPVTDKDGLATLPALVPGVRYQIAGCWDGRGTWGKPFTVRAGANVNLPDLNLRRPRAK
jgi:RNA polymerase sigma factor (sigma-70 family)